MERLIIKNKRIISKIIENKRISNIIENNKIIKILRDIIISNSKYLRYNI